MGTATVPMTLAEYAVLDEPADENVSELVRGVVIREPRPGRSHGRVQTRIAAALDSWGGPAGAEVTTESGYILSEEPATLRGPDVAVVLDPGSRRTSRSGWVHGAPEVAVEVLSPADASTAIQQKTLDYLRAGARLVWVVDPMAETVTVYRPDGSARLLRENETLEGEDVLRDFSVPLSELFEAR